MADSSLVKNVIAPWGWSLSAMFNPWRYGAESDDYLNDPDGGYLPPDGSTPGGGFGGPPAWDPSTNSFGGWSATGGPPGGGGYGSQAYGDAPGRGPIGRPPGGGGGGGGPGGPGGGMGDPYMMESFMRQYMDLGFNRAFQAPQSPEEIYARANSHGRFANAYGDFDNFMGVRPGGGSGQFFGGYDQDGNPLQAGSSNIFGLMNQMAGNRTADAYMQPGRAVDDLGGISQWRLEGEQGRYLDPRQAASGVFGVLQERNAMGLDPYARATEGLNAIKRQSNKYERDLISGIDEETKINLATQVPEVSAALQSAGYGESGAGMRAMGDVMRDVQGQGNRDKIRALADFRESNLGRIAGAIQQRTGIGADDANAAFGSAANAYGQGMGAREQALNMMYGSGADLIGRGVDNRARSLDMLQQLGLQGAIAGSDDEFRRQASGQDFLARLFGMREGTYDSRMDRALGLGRSAQDYEQQYRDQIRDLLLMPYRTGMQITTGINTSPTGGGYRVSPWEQMGANFAGQALGNFAFPAETGNRDDLYFEG